MRPMPQLHLYICAYGCLCAWLVFSTVSRSMLVAAAVIATPLCSLPPPSTLLPLPDTTPPPPICLAQRSTQPESAKDRVGERSAGFSYRGGGDTTEPGPFFRGVWLLSAGTMSEDNHSHYRLDPSDRLSGLGQRKKRPKKVKVKALRERGGYCLLPAGGGGAGGAGVCGGVIVEGDGSIYQQDV